MLWLISRSRPRQHPLTGSGGKPLECGPEPAGRVITGFNTDVKYRGTVYHVQTEDKGQQNPLIETLVYKKGEILASRRLPYADIITDRSDEAAITKLMEDQHRGMVLEIKRGRFDPEGAQTVMEDLSLDEIVLAYLASRAAGTLPH